MTRNEAVNLLINVTADIGKIEHRDLWHYEQALSEIKEMLEESADVVRCRDCKYATMGECEHKLGLIVANDENYCSYGERKDERLNKQTGGDECLCGTRQAV